MSGDERAGSRAEVFEAHLRAERDVVKWRRRALDQQLPVVGFPNGAGAPSSVYLLVTALLACAAVAVFALQSGTGVPQAVFDSQRDSVNKLARSMDAAYRLDVDNVERALDTYRESTSPDAKKLLDAVMEADTWAGAAVVETATSAVVQTSGVPVPADLLAAPRPVGATVAAMTDDGPALLFAQAVDDTRTLVAHQPVRMRNLRLNPDAGHGVYVLTASSEHALLQGVLAADEQTLASVFAGLGTIAASRSDERVLPGADGKRLVVSAAPVRAAGLVVVSVVAADVMSGTSVAHGVMLGASLLAVALVGFAVMRLSFTVPLRRLLRRAKADACGEPVKRRQSLRTAEMFRVARALAVSSNASLRAKRWRPSVVSGLALATVLTLAWAGVVATLAYQSRPAQLPTQLIIDEENRVESAAVMFGHALDTGLGAVSRLVAQDGDRAAGEMEGPLRRLHAEQSRFRAVYLVDAEGRKLAGAGEQPLRRQQPVPGEIGVRLDEAGGRVPMVYAYRLTSDGRAVVGEFDVDYLRGLLRQAGGQARVVDAQLRTVLDSEGYLAFEPAGDALVRQVAVATLPGGTVSATSAGSGGHTLVAATGLQSPATIAHLEWSLVVERDVAAMWLPQSIMRRWTLLVAGLAAGVAVLVFAWHWFVFVRPLRRLAAAADAISEGVFDLPVSPQRHDEIGIIAMCLEICRQVRHTGSARFGGAVRIRGSEADYTAVLPRARSRQSEMAQV